MGCVLGLICLCAFLFDCIWYVLLWLVAYCVCVWMQFVGLFVVWFLLFCFTVGVFVFDMLCVFVLAAILRCVNSVVYVGNDLLHVVCNGLVVLTIGLCFIMVW